EHRESQKRSSAAPIRVLRSACRVVSDRGKFSQGGTRYVELVHPRESEMCVVARRARFDRPALQRAATVQSTCATPSKQQRLASQLSRRAGAKSSALGFSQPITETADGFNRVTSLAQFFTQPAHVRVHRASVDHAFVAPNFVKQPIAVLHAATALHQCAQQLELETGQVHLLAVNAN